MKKTFILIGTILLIVFIVVPKKSTSENIVLNVYVSAPTNPPVNPPPSSPPSGGGGGGGGGGVIGGGVSGIQGPLNSVSFEGIGYPGSTVVLLKDGIIAAQVPAGPDAVFRITLSGMTSGTYSFSVWSKDSQGHRSVAHTFTESITSGVSTVISGIFLPPTISIDKTQVRRGDVVTFLGQSAPETDITLAVHSDQEINKIITTNKSGLWKYTLNTLVLEYGSHTGQVQATKDTDISAFSELLSFIVGNKNVLSTFSNTELVGDVNGDGKVNLIDFSILAYWYKRPLTTEAALKADLNHDGKVDLIDFSIMAYHWTG